MKFKVRWDENLGYWCGIVTVVIIGKYWLVPDIGTWDILWVLFKRLMGW